MHPNNPLNQCSDEELLNQLRNGQRDVLGTLIRRYQRELYGYLRRYLGDADLAEDVFQATFLQVYLKIAQYEPGRSARPWIYTIATHQAIDAIVPGGPAVDDQPGADSGGEGGNGEVRSMIEMLEARGAGPTEQVLASEQLRAWSGPASTSCPKFLRQVVVLSRLPGLRDREVAEILGVPVGTVKSRLHTALLKLQESWSESHSLPEL